MNSSVKVCNDYVNSVLAPQMNPKALAEIREIEKNKDFANPKYMGLLLTEFYTKLYIAILSMNGPDIFTNTWDIRIIKSII